MFAIIVNPVSGNRDHEALLRGVCKAVAAHGDSARVYETQCEGDGVRCTKQAIEAGCTSVVGLGGDGTLSEIVSVLAGTTIPLYIVPCGTGNDFARAFGLPRHPLRAFEAQLEGEAVPVDCLKVNGHPFLNVGGTGFDVEVLRKLETYRTLYPGEKAYRKAVFAVLSEYRVLDAQISVDDGPFTRVRATIVEAANGQYIGGGMRVAPDARCDDGLIDVVVVRQVPRWVIALLLPLFICGWHARLPICRTVRARHVTLRAHDMMVNIDGRLEAMEEAAFSVWPGALSMRRPKRR